MVVDLLGRLFQALYRANYFIGEALNKKGIYGLKYEVRITKSSLIQVTMLLVILATPLSLGEGNPSEVGGSEQSPIDWYNQGINLYTMGKYDGALLAFDQYIQINNRSAEAWSCKGVILGDQGKYEKALKAFNMALNINPSYAEAWYNMGVIYDIQEDINSAIYCYNQATNINPSYQQAWYLKNRDLDRIGVGHTSLYKEMAAEQGLTHY